MAALKEFIWSEAWKEKLANSSHKVKLKRCGISSEEFWDGYSPWQKLFQYNQYPGKALDFIMQSVDQYSSVLDVGAGSGALTIPIARVAKQVTAVEPSFGQVSRMIESADKLSINNISIIQKRWEDVSLEELGKHDVVTAAYCFQMEDITSSLDKMYQAAKKCMFLLHFADHDLQTPLQNIIVNFRVSPNYIFLYNVLYEMGYHASIEIIKREYEIPLDLQLDMLIYSHDMSSRQIEILRRYLDLNGKICRHNGSLWVKRKYNDALISLRKE